MNWNFPLRSKKSQLKYVEISTILNSHYSSCSTCCRLWTEDFSPESCFHPLYVVYFYCFQPTCIFSVSNRHVFLTLKMCGMNMRSLFSSDKCYSGIFVFLSFYFSLIFDLKGICPRNACMVFRNITRFEKTLEENIFETITVIWRFHLKSKYLKSILKHFDLH